GQKRFHPCVLDEADYRCAIEIRRSHLAAKEKGASSAPQGHAGFVLVASEHLPALDRVDAWAHPRKREPGPFLVRQTTVLARDQKLPLRRRRPEVNRLQILQLEVVLLPAVRGAEAGTWLQPHDRLEEIGPRGGHVPPE